MLFNNLSEIENLWEVKPYLNRYVASRINAQGILERAEIVAFNSQWKMGQWSELFGLVAID